MIDDLIKGFDRALRTLASVEPATRPAPHRHVAAAELSPEERRHVGGLMRVNHAGEVCAQALYEGQALTARSPANRQRLEEAAGEERDHLAWCRERLRELDAAPSVLNPLWYAGSFVLGAAAGLAGDRVSLGFVEAIEDGVVQHLEDHEAQLPAQDERSRELLAAMRREEAQHGEAALAHGGEAFPAPVKQVMRTAARLMTSTSYRI